VTREQIIAAAKEAGFKPGFLGHIYVGSSTEAVERFYALAHEAGRVAEREECAKVCDEIAEADNGYWCAMTIRARSTKA
jgi:hypothetical protein